jgi:hypothetical protein
MCMETHWKIFGAWSREKLWQRNSIWNPII